jgi:hypothetical protein
VDERLGVVRCRSAVRSSSSEAVVRAVQVARMPRGIGARVGCTTASRRRREAAQRLAHLGRVAVGGDLYALVLPMTSLASRFARDRGLLRSCR